ncbi:peptidoglycan editing factor PgeF [Candidatus Roizmanbacteria bacterium]|nr:peptidoglycan editing factor PgeF [Candidatus Roizmanbacteria bacterium]
MILKNNFYKFNNLSSYPDLIHGFSTRFFGSMRPKHEEHKQSMQNFAHEIGIPAKNIVTMGQKHTNNVYCATDKNLGGVIPDTDSIVTQNKNVFLGVVTADCLPIFMYNPNKKVVAAIHAGWRGLFGGIIKETVAEFIAQGSKPQDLIVGIGPCIRSCCYEIAQDHKNKLIEKPDWEQFIIERERRLFLDLPGVALHQLTSLQITKNNIEDGNYCTFEHEDVYSRRKEGEDFGEIIGIIGIEA